MVGFTKLSDLVDDTFTIEKVLDYKFKMWDNENRKMLVSDTPQKGYRKVYMVQTDKGLLDLGTGQIGSLLEEVFVNGTADLNGETFEVKSNGKTGKDIRYFFNQAKAKAAEPDFDPFEGMEVL